MKSFFREVEAIPWSRDGVYIPVLSIKHCFFFFVCVLLCRQLLPSRGILNQRNKVNKGTAVCCRVYCVCETNAVD